MNLSRIAALGCIVASLCTYAADPAPLDSANFQGLWWNSQESGWAISLAHQDDVIFATWATYDIKGRPLWLSMTATRAAAGSYAGTLYQTEDPEFHSAPTDVGRGTLTFNSASEGRFAYTAFGVERAVTITPYVFGAQATCTWAALDSRLATNYQDLWYASPAGSDPGWGLSLAHQGDVIVAIWFSYNYDGSPNWLWAAASKTESGVYVGPMMSATGPAFSSSSFRSEEVSLRPVGSITLTFTDGNNAIFSVSWIGTGSYSQPITRFVFRPPGTVCQ